MMMNNLRLCTFKSVAHLIGAPIVSNAGHTHIFYMHRILNIDSQCNGNNNLPTAAPGRPATQRGRVYFIQFGIIKVDWTGLVEPKHISPLFKVEPRTSENKTWVGPVHLCVASMCFAL